MGRLMIEDTYVSCSNWQMLEVSALGVGDVYIYISMYIHVQRLGWQLY